VAGALAAYRAQLHYVGHLDAIKSALTGRETLLFWAALRGLSGSRAIPALDRALHAFALEGIADWPCRWLSAGQRRRLALSRLLATPAPLWLLDEPTSGLDDENRLRLEAIIAAHRADGGRVVLSTHAPFPLVGAQSLVLDAFSPARGERQPR
jgi:heme exporter protein A